MQGARDVRQLENVLGKVSFLVSDRYFRGFPVGRTLFYQERKTQMKIIEAMKRVKLNKDKIADLQQKIAQNAANTTLDTPLYENPRQKVDEWLQSCTDLSQENVKLLCAIQRTNLVTMVPIEVEPGLTATHSIAAWVWRRREYAGLDLKTWQSLGDRGIREGQMPSTIPGQAPTEVKIVRHYNPEQRDKKASMYKSEPTVIDSTLEIVNAVTDLIED